MSAGLGNLFFQMFAFELLPIQFPWCWHMQVAHAAASLASPLLGKAVVPLTRLSKNHRAASCAEKDSSRKVFELKTDHNMVQGEVCLGLFFSLFVCLFSAF